MIIGITGLSYDGEHQSIAGSGKDTVAEQLVKKHRFTAIALADPMKRFCKEIFDFTDEQLWGSSEKRNEPDKRYLRPSGGFVFPHAPPGAAWIPLVNGRGHVLVDGEDYDELSQYRWRFNEKPDRRTSYANTEIDGRPTKLHGLLMGPAPEGQVIDHINGDGLDNRRKNLRFCTQSENHANEHPRKGSSPFKGVSFDKSRNKWSAKITVEGKTINLGRFDREGQAALAYDNEARKRFGRAARLNTDTFLTPRYALQTLGTEWARFLHQDVWVDYCLRVAKKILTPYDPNHEAVKVGWLHYAQETGFDGTFGLKEPGGVVIPDVRFINEFERIKEVGGKVWRVKRRVDSVPKELGEGHLSERELLELPDSQFDAILPNEGSIHHLNLLVDAIMARESGRIVDYDEQQADVPPFKRT